MGRNLSTLFNAQEYGNASAEYHRRANWPQRPAVCLDFFFCLFVCAPPAIGCFQMDLFLSPTSLSSFLKVMNEPIPKFKNHRNRIPKYKDNK